MNRFAKKSHFLEEGAAPNYAEKMHTVSPYLLHAAKLSAVDLGLVRSPGPGLGNLLFPIARALIGAAKHGGIFVKPTIRQVKLGPIFRGESDWRTYGNVMNGRSGLEWLFWSRSKLRRTTSEVDYVDQKITTVIYEGLGRQFYDLVGHRDLLIDYLRNNAIGVEELGPRYDVAIHIRRGDFVVGGNHKKKNIQTPTDWYRRAWQASQETLKLKEMRTILFTDGDPHAVRAELGLPGVEIDNSPNALIAMMKMANADLLIGSRSTFSLWGCFLGGGHAIWPKQFDLGLYKPVDIVKDNFL